MMGDTRATDPFIRPHNRHVFHAGFEFWRDRVNTFYTGNNGALGSINFSGIFTSSAPAASGTGGYGGADFYPGLPLHYRRGVSGGAGGQRARGFGPYIPDGLASTTNLMGNPVFR